MDVRETPNSAGILVVNVELATEQNGYFRHVITTIDSGLQLVLMSLSPGRDIGLEIHPNTDQFLRVEEGSGIGQIGDKMYRLGPGDALIVPRGTQHNITNDGIIDLKLYTLYSQPEHPHGLVEE